MAKRRKYTLLLGVCGVILTCTILVSQVYGLAESTASGGSNAQAVHQLGETGDNVNVGLIGANKNIYAGHEAFFDKDVNGNPIGLPHAFNHDMTSDGNVPLDHDTWMAGIIASRGGKLYPNDIGTARDCEIHCMRIVADDDNDVYLPEGLSELIQILGCRVVTTSFAYGGTADGQSLATRVYDYYAFTYDDVVFTHASGNGNTGGIWVVGDAFNGITTGGLVETKPGIYGQVGDVSSVGPTTDGRRKPDIVAPSSAQHVPHLGTSTWQIPPYDSGATSLSVPHAAGVAALLVGLADETLNSNDGHNDVIRAVIVNSAFPNIKDRDGASTDPMNNVWNTNRGYGRIDALRAYQLLSTAQVYKGTTISQLKGWAYATVTSQNQQDNYYIVGEKNHRLVLTATWNRKINSPPNYNEDTPPFNLNLTVKHSNGTVLFTETDLNENLEKVDLLLPYADTYTVNLTNPNINKTRSYGLAFELIEPVQADLNLDYGVDEDDLVLLKNNWLQNNPEVDTALFEDGTVNLKDFAVLANNWRNSNPAYYSQ